MQALILVDIQNDFLPHGALAVPNGDQVIPIANQLMSPLRGWRFAFDKRSMGLRPWLHHFAPAGLRITGDQVR